MGYIQRGGVPIIKERDIASEMVIMHRIAQTEEGEPCCSSEEQPHYRYGYCRSVIHEKSL